MSDEHPIRLTEEFHPDNIDVAHRLFLESERMYPVIPWQLRTVMNSCVVDGFEIPPGMRLLNCQTASHHLRDLYKDPLDFDIDRYLPDRKEHMGHQWVELQMAVNLLLIACHSTLELVPEDYKLRINPFPTAVPNRKMKFRVAELDPA